MLHRVECTRFVLVVARFPISGDSAISTPVEPCRAVWTVSMDFTGQDHERWHSKSGLVEALYRGYGSYELKSCSLQIVCTGYGKVQIRLLN